LLTTLGADLHDEAHMTPSNHAVRGHQFGGGRGGYRWCLFDLDYNGMDFVGSLFIVEFLQTKQLKPGVVSFHVWTEDNR
jgi:hypothetical protein